MLCFVRLAVLLSVVPLLLFSLLVAPGCGGDGAVIGGIVNHAPRIVRATITPAELTFRGGAVQLAVTEADDLGVAQVTARVVLDAIDETVSLAQANGQWVGEWDVPGNATDVVQVYTIIFVATDVHGATSKPVTRTVSAGVVNDEPQPPGPPPPQAP